VVSGRQVSSKNPRSDRQGLGVRPLDLSGNEFSVASALKSVENMLGSVSQLMMKGGTISLGQSMSSPSAATASISAAVMRSFAAIGMSFIAAFYVLRFVMVRAVLHDYNVSTPA
jgi:hypothetical protein